VAQAWSDTLRALFVGTVVLRYGIAWLLAHAIGRGSAGSPYLRVRLVFEELGVTYVKLGQFLAARFDLIPPALCQELNALFEHVPPIDTNEVRRVIERELCAPCAQLFHHFEETCLASASIAQVHKARTRDGEWVAVKVQRPGVAAAFAADMRNLRRLARLVDALDLARSVSAVRFVEEFAAYTSREFDQLLEARTAERIRQHAHPSVYVPRVRWDLTSPRVLALEFIDGISVGEASRMVEAGLVQELHQRVPGLDLGRVARDLASATLHQLFVCGFFHADPHPGNILIRRDGRVCLVDFGIFGEIREAHRKGLARYVETLAAGRIDESFRVYRRLLEYSPRTNSSAFEREVKTLLWRYYEASGRSGAIAARHLGKFADELMALLYRNRVRLDLDTLLFWRALIVLDATFLKRAGDFDLQAAVREFFLARGFGLLRLVPTLAGIDWSEATGEFARLARGFPVPYLSGAAA
jgi:ubiquinone biosynthesis protein